MYLNVCVYNKFLNLTDEQINESAELMAQTCVNIYFVCKLSFRDISMIIMIICNQNKLFW